MGMIKTENWAVPTICDRCHKTYGRKSNKQSVCDNCWELTHHKVWKPISTKRMNESKSLLNLLKNAKMLGVML